VVPFTVVVVFNAATVFTLCRNRMRMNTVSGTRNYVNAFTKLTLTTGLSFVVAFDVEVIRPCLPYNPEIYIPLIRVASCLQYLHSCMNLIICLILCKSARDEMQQYLRFIAQKVMCTCRRLRLAASTTNENPENIALEQVVADNAGTMKQIVFDTTGAVEQEVSGNAGTMKQIVSDNTGAVEQEVSGNVGTMEKVGSVYGDTMLNFTSMPV